MLNASCWRAAQETKSALKVLRWSMCNFAHPLSSQRWLGKSGASDFFTPSARESKKVASRGLFKKELLLNCSDLSSVRPSALLLRPRRWKTLLDFESFVWRNASDAGRLDLIEGRAADHRRASYLIDIVVTNDFSVRPFFVFGTWTLWAPSPSNSYTLSHCYILYTVFFGPHRQLCC